MDDHVALDTNPDNGCRESLSSDGQWHTDKLAFRTGVNFPSKDKPLLNMHLNDYSTDGKVELFLDNVSIVKSTNASTNASLMFPLSTDNISDYSFTAGSPFHGVNKGIKGADDTYAWDINRPDKKDDGMDVSAVEDGQVITIVPSYGAVLVKHEKVLSLASGTSLNEWFSVYLHMEGIPENIKVGAMVTKGENLGKVGKKGGVSNKHLHFAIYYGDIHIDKKGQITSLRDLVNLDIANELPEFRAIIKDWVDWCGAKSISHDAPWWSTGQTPCKK